MERDYMAPPAGHLQTAINKKTKARPSAKQKPGRSAGGKQILVSPVKHSADSSNEMESEQLPDYSGAMLAIARAFKEIECQ
jgi:hypothetical protein